MGKQNVFKKKYLKSLTENQERQFNVSHASAEKLDNGHILARHQMFGPC